MSIVNLERITWIDSGMHFATGWNSMSMVRSTISEWNGESFTVGWNVYEDDQVVVLVQTLDGAKDNVAGAWAIYKPCIVERVTLDKKEWKHG